MTLCYKYKYNVVQEWFLFNLRRVATFDNMFVSLSLKESASIVKKSVKKSNLKKIREKKKKQRTKEKEI